MVEGRLLTPPSWAWIMLNTAARTFSIMGRVCRPRADTSVRPGEKRQCVVVVVFDGGGGGDGVC